jgi:rare lipoprotein A
MIREARAVIIAVSMLFALGAVSAAERTAYRQQTDLTDHQPGKAKKSLTRSRRVDRGQSCAGASRCKSARTALKAKKFHSRSETRAWRAKRARLAARLRVYDAGHRGRTIPGAIYRVGVPYRISGQLYTPRVDPNYRAEGKASWYGDDFHGRRTANGEIFNMHALSAAHPTLPLPCYVRVTNLENDRSLVVRLNDRGPFHGRRLIDVSVRAAQLLGFYDRGIARVRVEYIGLASLKGSNDTKLAQSLQNGERKESAMHVAAREPARANRK